MICTNCGENVWSMSGRCPLCGHGLGRQASAKAEAAARQNRETLLFSFGPFGVEVCEGPFSVWKPHRRNCFVVELTDTRLCLVASTGFGFFSVPALRYPWGVRLPLQIPCSSVISAEVCRHPSPISLLEVLDVRYREGESEREISIAARRGNVRRAREIIEEQTR